MDPLSLIATVAGVATAGVQISMVLFEISNKIAHAPKEVAEIASEIASLSTVLEHFRDILDEGIKKKLYRDRVISDTIDLLTRIAEIQSKIQRKTKGSGSWKFRVKWAFFSSAQAETTIAKLSSIKMTLHLMLSTMQLALLSSERDKGTRSDGSAAKGYRFRELVETLVEAQRDSVHKLETKIKAEASLDGYHARDAKASEQTLVPWQSKTPDDSADWLATFTNPEFRGRKQQLSGVYALDDDEGQVGDDTVGLEPREEGESESLQMLVVSWKSSSRQKQLVDQLLLGWTSLTAGQIEKTTSKSSGKIDLDLVEAPDSNSNNGSSASQKSLPSRELPEKVPEPRPEPSLKKEVRSAAAYKISSFLSSEESEPEQRAPGWYDKEKNPFKRPPTSKHRNGKPRLRNPYSPFSGEPFASPPAQSDPYLGQQATANPFTQVPFPYTTHPPTMHNPPIPHPQAFPGFPYYNPYAFSPYGSQFPGYYPIPPPPPQLVPTSVPVSEPITSKQTQLSEAETMQHETREAIRTLLVDLKRREEQLAAESRAVAEARAAAAKSATIKMEEDKLSKLQDLILQHNKAQMEREKRHEEIRAAAEQGKMEAERQAAYERKEEKQQHKEEIEELRKAFQLSKSERINQPKPPRSVEVEDAEDVEQ